MAYTTAAGTTTAEADAYAGGTGLPETKQDAILRDSERLVARYAPAPDPVTAEYTSAASDSEMRVFEYLTTTSGYMSSVGLSGISVSYIDLAKIQSLVTGIMADYADSATDVAYIERWG